MSEKPWIILTMRRTGGTSLTRFLSKISSYQTVEHEPFNRKRRFGWITKKYLDDKNSAAAEKAIKSALTDKPNIKHCFEFVPIEITRVLIDACAELDYQMLILTRRNEHRRLASLLLAESTGAWGPDQAKIIYPEIISGRSIPVPISLVKVAHRAKMNFAVLGQVLLLIRIRKIDFQWLLFEELYFGQKPIQEQAIDIANSLGIPIQIDDERLDLLSKETAQNSSDIAPYVENYEEALAILRAVCPN